MKMYEHFLTIGLFDKNCEKQKINTQTAKNIITNTLINKFNIYSFTMFDVAGIYKMQITGTIVKEPSIRIEIAAGPSKETIYKVINTLKIKLNQESIMYKMVESEIDFA